MREIYFLSGGDDRVMDDLKRCRDFQWDQGNLTKNWDKHRVTCAECEQVFLNRPFVLAEDVRHSRTEVRYYALGTTTAGRGLFIVFTVRGESIRIICARDMSVRERRAYCAIQESDAEI